MIQEALREHGAKVFHDIKGDNFNIDHVVIHQSGVYVIETKTYSKPDKGKPEIVFDGETVRIFGREPDRNPVTQVRALTRWISDALKESTGKSFTMRSVVVFPGWYIEPSAEAKSSDVWVLNPKALPEYNKNSHMKLSNEDVQLASYHLSRHIRSSESPVTA